MRHRGWLDPRRVSRNRSLRLMDNPILSPREKRLLRRLARGRSDHAIAVQIGGREDQVGEQRKRLLQKLQISSQSEIAEAAARWAFWPSHRAADELAPWPKRREDGGHEPPS
jgi:DNA-binding CsgD family transcriptional regulator